jgi:hypothetical protein
LVPVRLLPEAPTAAVEVVWPHGLILRVHDEAATDNVRRMLQLLHELA